MDIGIIGAGITGLTAAYDLTRMGHAVTVLETQPSAGGMAAGFHDDQWEWPLERFYHHWFATDQSVISLIDELGVRDRLFFPRPTTSIYQEGQIYPFDSVGGVLGFRPLPVRDRLRVGLVTLYLKLIRNWRPLERVSAEAWTRRVAGKRGYEVLWKPLLISKFGEDKYRQVNMAWLWARLHKRTPRLGYFVGGFQGFADRIVEQVHAQGGEVRLDSEVRAISPTTDGRLRLDSTMGVADYERVIATCSPQETIRLTAGLPLGYVEKLSRLESMSAVVLVLALHRSLVQRHYWINLPADAGFPFMGLVEHTNFISSQHYGGDHLIYCGDYLLPDHPYLHYDKEQLLKTYLPGLTKVNSEFRRDWIRDSWMFTEAYAQPIPTIDHSHSIPPLATPVPGLWMANMSQVYPWDRGSNYAVELGRRVAQEVIR